MGSRSSAARNYSRTRTVTPPTPRALRDAREETALDATSTATFVAIERLGAFLVGKPKAFWTDITTKLTEFLEAHAPAPVPPDHATLVKHVKDARNDHMHIGPTGRRAVRLATDLTLRLEEALMAKAPNPCTAADLMTSPVTIAQPWETLYELRRHLLTRGYSALPWRDGGTWRLVTAGWIARRLIEDQKNAKATLNEVAPDPPPCPTVDPSAPLGTINPSGIVLVADGDHALGIITTTDRLAALR